MEPVHDDSHCETLTVPMLKQHTWPGMHWLELSHARKKPVVVHAVDCVQVPPPAPCVQQPCPAAMSHDVDPHATAAGPASGEVDASTWSGGATASLALLPSTVGENPSLPIPPSPPPSQLRHAPPSSPPQPEKSVHAVSATVVDARATWRKGTSES